MCKKTLSELDTVIRRINTHPEYNRHQTQQFLADLRKESDSHSVTMEIEAQHSSSNQPWNEHKKPTHIKNRCESIRRLEEAWNHIATNGLSVGTLASLGYIVEPSETNRGFRKKDVFFGDFDGSDTSKILQDLNTVILDFDMLEEQRRHPVIAAAATHVGIVNVHPYMDGNGRVARIVQEYILQSNGSSPAIIPANEGKTYRKLMASVLNDRRHLTSTVFEPSTNEKSFYDYIASKCLLSARSLEESLRENRVYHASVRGVNERIKFALKHRLVGLNSTIPGAISVRMLNRKGSSSEISYEIKGNISLEEVRGVVKKAADQYHLNDFVVRPYQTLSEAPSCEFDSAL